jgi:PAS domain S-box-containing protein
MPRERGSHAPDRSLTGEGGWDPGQFATLVANVPGAVYRGELSTDWAVQFMSDGVEAICGYAAADFVGSRPARTFASVIHPDDRELVEQAVEAALALREPYVIDYRITHASGELRWVHECGRGVFGPDGRALFLDGVLFDHTPQRLIEEQHRLLFEHNPQPMLAYDRETLRIVAASNAATASYGYSHEELLSMTVRDLVPPEDLPAVDRYLATALSGEEPGLVLARQWRHRYKDGTVVDVEINSDDLTLNGRSCRVLLCQDVTERNLATAALAAARDAAVEASNMKSAFLANMSHEIRTPMNAVIGMNELLLDTELSDEQRFLAAQAAQSGEQLLAIINDVLDVSKIEAGRLELDLTDFDLHTLIDQVCATARLQVGQRGVALELEFGDDVPDRVHGDAARLRQVLTNLLSNAAKFTREGEIRVRVTSGPDAPVRFAVSDTGIGIDATVLVQMFEPFTQADTSTTRVFGGTGLGLAIARDLVALMGGTIGADSDPGSGSTFWFELPLGAARTPDVNATLDARRPSRESTHSGDGPTVLIVEDNPINQLVAVRSLERCGIRADVASDGLEALDALAARRYDAVLMDCQLPVMNGYDATIEIRRREQKTGGHVPIIAMTASAMTGDRDLCIKAGMDDYVTKPIRPHHLADVLNRWINTRSAPAADAAASAAKSAT